MLSGLLLLPLQQDALMQSVLQQLPLCPKKSPQSHAVGL
jgi:hypothetical protein